MLKTDEVPIIPVSPNRLPLRMADLEDLSGFHFSVDGLAVMSL